MINVGRINTIISANTAKIGIKRILLDSKPVKCETIKNHIVITNIELNKSDKISSSRHRASDRTSVHNAVLRANNDINFISAAMKHLDALEFPVYKYQILEFVKKVSTDRDVIALLESLNDTATYHSRDEIKKALEQENPEAKRQNQISDNTRKNLHVQQVDKAQKRKDYPEAPATAMKNYSCRLCGKEFQSGTELKDHEKFESGRKKE